MSVILIIIPIIVFLLFTQSLKIVNEDQRGVLFRLGRFEKIFKPGLILIIPILDRLIKVNLNKEIPGWKGLSIDQLESKVKKVVLGESN